MKKIDPKDLITRAKEKPKRTNYTFRLRDDLMNAFKSKVEKENAKTTAVLEEFLKVFTGLE